MKGKDKEEREKWGNEKKKREKEAQKRWLVGCLLNVKVEQIGLILHQQSAKVCNL